MESHYCRATSQKKYLLAEWHSKQSLYEFYVQDWCKSMKKDALSIATFSKTFEEKNMALFHPKKDKCEKCVGYRVGQVSEDEFNSHIQKKTEARKEKEKDKKEGKYLFTADLMAPKSKVSTLYYKIKLQVHNLCFYNLINSDAYCFVWNECEGGVGAEEFASIWMYFVEQKILPNIPPLEDTNERITIIIYTDGCGYQNRNSVMSNVLLNVAITCNLIIEQKYL